MHMEKVLHRSKANVKRIKVIIFEIHGIAFSIDADALWKNAFFFNFPDNFSIHAHLFKE